MASPRDNQTLDRQPRKRTPSPQRSISRSLSAEEIQIKNEIKEQLQPVIKQWLATQPNLSEADRQKIGRAIRAAYKQGKTAVDTLGRPLPDTINHVLVQQAERYQSPQVRFKQQLDNWIQGSDRDPIQQVRRQLAAAKIRDVYYNKADCLDLQAMQLTSLPSVLGELTSLRSLSLRNNPLRTLPDTLNQLTSLTFIDCRGNSFTEFPQVLKKLPLLNTVLFRDNPPSASRKNQEIRPQNGPLFHAEVVWKAKQFKGSLDAWVQGGTEKESRKRAEAARRIQTAYDQQLDRLDLAGWELSELPEVLVQLHSLKKLNISYNCLKQLPTWFNQLKNLKTVHVEGNYFIKLPEVLQAMPITLDIAKPGELMTELAERMEFESLIKTWKEQEGSVGVARKSGAADILLKAYYQKSTHLYLSNHKLPNLPEGVFSKLGQLQSVILFNNQLQALPDDFAQLKLKHLDLAYNQFSKFPTPLQSMATLEHLTLFHNSLTQISAESVVDLQQLKHLNLGSNKLNQLFVSDSSTPLSRELLPKLESLNFNDNELTQLPELKRLLHLKELGGAGNYLDPVPDILRKLRNPWFQPSWDNPQAPWVQRQLPANIQLEGPAVNRLSESMSGAGGVYGAGSGRTEPAFKPLNERQTLPTRTDTGA